jgi:hypothetical protein
MDLMQIGAQLLQSKLGSNVQTGDILTQLINKASSGDAMIDSAMGSKGGAGGLMGMAGKLFGK